MRQHHRSRRLAAGRARTTSTANSPQLFTPWFKLERRPSYAGTSQSGEALAVARATTDRTLGTMLGGGPVKLLAAKFRHDAEADDAR